MTLFSASESCLSRGPAAPCHRAERYPSNNPRRCSPSPDCSIHTTVGILKPRSEADFPRHPDVEAVEFHDSGHPDRVAIESATVPTPLGEVPAELLLFHRDGAIRRVFPLDGHLDGYWEEAQEADLAPSLTIPSPLGDLTARFIAIAFFPSGKLRSLTLWPRERLVIRTPAGAIWIRVGISFHEDGTLESVEPHETLKIETPLGPLSAFDPSPLGVNGDRNSLAWTPAGALHRVVTAVESFVCKSDDGCDERWSPHVEAMDCDGGCGVSEALKLTFLGDRVTIEQGRRKGTYAVSSVHVMRRADADRRHLNVMK